MRCSIIMICCLLLMQKMPEEEAFAVLVKIMYNYGHRDVFKANFQNLHLMFYQLERLIEVYNVLELVPHNHSPSHSPISFPLPFPSASHFLSTSHIDSTCGNRSTCLTSISTFRLIVLRLTCTPRSGSSPSTQPSSLSPLSSEY